jgi:hypothetical protein
MSTLRAQMMNIGTTYLTSPLVWEALTQYLPISKLFENLKGQKHYWNTLKDNIEEVGCENVNWINLDEDIVRKRHWKQHNEPLGFIA